jgi:hypothetical protein
VRDFSCNDVVRHKSLHYGEMQLAGSGCDHHLNILQNLDNETPVGYGNQSDFAVAVSKLLMLACYVLGEEKNARGNLMSFYGGGFEIVYFNQGKFQKLQDMTFVFSEVTVVSRNLLQIAVQLAVKFLYTKDILVLHRMDFAHTPDGSNAALFVAEPIHRSLKKNDVEELKGMAFPT